MNLDPNHTPDVADTSAASAESSNENANARFLFSGPPETGDTGTTIAPDLDDASSGSSASVPPVQPVQPAPAAVPVQASPQSQTPAAPAVVPVVPTLAITDIVPPVVQPVVPAQAAPVQPVQPAQPVVPVQQVPPAQPRPSEAQVKASLNFYEVSEQDYDAVFAVEDKAQSIAALNNILQKAVRQAVTMSHTLAQEKIGAIVQQVQPYMQFADEQRHSLIEQTFFTQNPELVNQRPLVDAVVNAFKQKNVKFNSPQELFTAIATNVKAYQQQLGGQTQSPRAAAPVAAPAGKPRMVPLSNGGQGGAAPSGGSSGGKSTAQAIFG